MPKGIKGFQKGHEPIGGRPQGSKNRETLLKEERRSIFEAQISQKWEQIIDQLPPTYIADQYLGKALDKIEHSGQIANSPETAELIEAAKKLLRKKMLHGD